MSRRRTWLLFVVVAVIVVVDILERRESALPRTSSSSSFFSQQQSALPQIDARAFEGGKVDIDGDNRPQSSSISRPSTPRHENSNATDFPLRELSLMTMAGFGASDCDEAVLEAPVNSAKLARWRLVPLAPSQAIAADLDEFVRGLSAAMDGDRPRPLLLVLDPKGSLDQSENLRRSLDNERVVARCRVIAGERVVLEDAPLSCKAVSATAFHVLPPHAVLPIVLTPDIARFLIRFARSTLVYKENICRHLPLAPCIGLLLQGRDIHLLRLSQLFSSMTEAARAAPQFDVALNLDGAARKAFPFRDATDRPLRSSRFGSDATAYLRESWNIPTTSTPAVSHRPLLAVVYVPVPLARRSLRESTRCFFERLPPHVRAAFALHFAVGARAGPTTYLWDAGKANDAHFNALSRENATSGDVLLFDVVDMDQADGPSGSLLKVLFGMFHAAQLYSFHYFVRGADDSYHNFVQMAMDFNASGRVPRERVYWGHVIGRAMSYHRGLRHVVHREVEESRNRAPIMTGQYCAGGGFVLSADVAQYLTSTHALLPAVIWMEEDTNLGLLIAPFAAANDVPQVHDFFNATPHIDRAYKGLVPFILDYCHEDDWIVHKYPWDALRRVDADSGRLYCTDEEFAGRKQHSCSAFLLRSFSPPARNHITSAYYHLSKPLSRTNRRKHPSLNYGGKISCDARNYQQWLQQCEEATRQHWESKKLW